MAGSRSSAQATKSKRAEAKQRLSMLVVALFCRDLLMRTRIWYLPELEWTISNAAPTVTVTSKSRQQVVEFGQPWKIRALREPAIISRNPNSYRLAF